MQEACRRCGELLTVDEVPDGICARCAEEVRNENFVDVEMDQWREQQETEDV